MSVNDSLSYVAAFGHLTLALFLVPRARNQPLGLMLALLCIDLCIWNFATATYHLTGNPTWDIIDTAFSPLAAPLSLHVVFSFVGRVRAKKYLLAIAYIYFGLLSLVSALRLFEAYDIKGLTSEVWSLFYLMGWLPILALSIVTLVKHLRQSIGFEHIRTQLMLAALVLGGTLGSTELWNDVGIPVPGLGGFSTLVSTSIITLMILRFDLFVRTEAVNTRERQKQLTMLGRFSAQIAHDLKNPLAALKGSIQYLSHRDVNRGSSEFLQYHNLALQQVDRINRIIDRYDHLSRIEPRFENANVNAIVQRVVTLYQSRMSPSIDATLQLEPSLPVLRIDSELLESAVENLILNAIEAMPQGGSLWVQTKVKRDHTWTPAIEIHVRDTGKGMDPREIQLALRDFYTTKSTGTGLGLAFVERVARVHGGAVEIVSRKGVGTTVYVTVSAM